MYQDLLHVHTSISSYLRACIYAYTTVYIGDDIDRARRVKSFNSEPEIALVDWKLYNDGMDYTYERRVVKYRFTWDRFTCIMVRPYIRGDSLGYIGWLHIYIHPGSSL